MWSETVQTAMNPFLDTRTMLSLGSVCRRGKSAYPGWLYQRQLAAAAGGGRRASRASTERLVRQMRAMGLFPLHCALSCRDEALVFRFALERYRGALLYPIHSEQDVRNFYSPHSMRVMSASKHPSWRWSRAYLRRVRRCLHHRQLYATQQLCEHDLDYACVKYHERRENLENGIIYALMDKLVPHYWSHDALAELLDHLGEPQPPAHWFALLCAASDNLVRQRRRRAFGRWARLSRVGG